MNCTGNGNGRCWGTPLPLCAGWQNTRCDQIMESVIVLFMPPVHLVRVLAHLVHPSCTSHTALDGASHVHGDVPVTRLTLQALPNMSQTGPEERVGVLPEGKVLMKRLKQITTLLKRLIKRSSSQKASKDATSQVRGLKRVHKLKRLIWNRRAFCRREDWQ